MSVNMSKCLVLLRTILADWLTVSAEEATNKFKRIDGLLSSNFSLLEKTLLG